MKVGFVGVVAGSDLEIFGDGVSEGWAVDVGLEGGEEKEER